MPISNYKESVIEGLRAESKSTKKAMADFFSANRTKAEKLEAFNVNGTFNDPADIEKALALLRDTAADADLRAAAALGLVHEASKNEELLNYLIGILQNDEAPVQLREAALSVLQAGTFSSPLFPAKRGEYMNALRSAATTGASGAGDKSVSPLRSRAIEYLALDHDDYIQGRLIEGLENPEKEIVEPEVAIQLLAYDLHADYYPTLRKIVKDPPNQRSKKEALRNLAADPDSVDLLVKTLNDPDEDNETRHACAVGLQSLAPDALQKSVKKLLTDPKEDKDLRVALLNTVTYTPDTKILDEDEAFQKKLESFQNESPSRKLKSVYKNYRQTKFK